MEQGGFPVATGGEPVVVIGQDDPRETFDSPQGYFPAEDRELETLDAGDEGPVPGHGGDGAVPPVPPALLGIVPNMVRKQTLEHQENLRILVEHFVQLVWPPIPLTVRLAEASAYGETIFDLEPNKSTAQSLAEIGQRIIENLEGGVK